MKILNISSSWAGDEILVSINGHGEYLIRPDRLITNGPTHRTSTWMEAIQIMLKDMRRKWPDTYAK